MYLTPGCGYSVESARERYCASIYPTMCESAKLIQHSFWDPQYDDMYVSGTVCIGPVVDRIRNWMMKDNIEIWAHE